VADLPLEGLRSIRGQSFAVELLLRAVANGRVASAYLFEGPDGVGKERTARALAQATVCREPLPDHDACGKCATCRQVAARTHVDVITLAREIDVLSQGEHRASDLKTEIVVEKVRLLQAERLAYQSHQGTRWVIVRHADEMNTQASNALLKTLEEPPSQTHFALITSRPTQLLTTIRSRCQRVRFAPLDEATVKDLLVRVGTAEDLATEAARLADGSMTKALEFAEPEILAARKEWVDRILAALRSGRAGAYVDVAEGIRDLGKSDAREVDAVLAMLERHFRDEALKYAADQGRRAATCAARADLVRQTVESFDRNLNLQMAVEAMRAGLREVRA
jgi:DNA polymerase-3 subunit delta'